MSSKTKIVVLHLKELIYTGIFIVLGILFIVLLIIMFFPGNKGNSNSSIESSSESIYSPGVYTTSLSLNDHTVDIEVVVDENHINSVRLVNLNETVTAMYPLIEPSFEQIANQLYETQSIDAITYSEDTKYTTLVLLDAINASLDKAKLTFDIE